MQIKMDLVVSFLISVPIPAASYSTDSTICKIMPYYKCTFPRSKIGLLNPNYSFSKDLLSILRLISVYHHYCCAEFEPRS
jgi:hypothetical protein